MSARPGIDGTAGRVPVAITARLNRNPCPFTATSAGPVNWASPKKTSTPRLVKRWAESCVPISALRRRIRRITSLKSTSTAPTLIPSTSPLRISSTIRAALNKLLDGTHPTFKQSPPRSARSTSATFAPNLAAPEAVTRPAVPAPITSKS